MNHGHITGGVSLYSGSLNIKYGLIQISRTSLTLWFPLGECLLCALQMDIISLFPLEVFYYFTGVNSLLRFPRLLKVRRFFCFVHSWSLWSGWTADLCFPLSVHGFLWVQRQNGICDEESVHLQVRRSPLFVLDITSLRITVQVGGVKVKM